MTAIKAPAEPKSFPSHCPSRTASPGSSTAGKTRPSPTRPTGSASTFRWTAVTARAARARRCASRAATTAAPTSTMRCRPTRPRRGYVLPCSMKPRSDLVLQIASTSDIAKTQAATFTGTVVESTGCRPPPCGLGVEIPNRSELAFLPGQYVNIAVPGTDQTAFVLLLQRTARRPAHLPGEADSRRRDVGLPGPARSRVGDTITFTGPHGSFFLRETDRPVLLLAGGTGLAPDPVDAAQDARRRQPAQGAPDLRREHRRRPGGTRSTDRGDRLDANRIHLGPLRLRSRPVHAPQTRAT